MDTRRNWEDDVGDFVLAAWDRFLDALETAWAELQRLAEEAGR